MGRRNRMWMTVICILAVGGFATKMTRQLVVSEETEAAAVLAVQNTMESGEETSDQGAVSAFVALPEEKERMTQKEEIVEKEMVEEEMVEEEASEISEVDGAKDTAAMETIKSPLDPAIEEDGKEAAASELKEDLNAYEAEELRKRLEDAEEKTGRLRKITPESNPGVLYAMAEQERLIWDRELSVISTSIRSRMSQEEAEDFKDFELEWLKERDRTADGAISRNTAVQGQNPDSARVLAEKTRERCYLLVREYEEILNRDGSESQADAILKEQMPESDRIRAQ